MDKAFHQDLFPRNEAPPRLPDMLGQRGAMRLAQRLEKYWHERGYPAARFWAEPVDERLSKIGTFEIYRVASNLVNALPPRYQNE
jgi:hypothetical protein